MACLGRTIHNGLRMRNLKSLGTPKLIKCCWLCAQALIMSMNATHCSDAMHYMGMSLQRDCIVALSVAKISQDSSSCKRHALCPGAFAGTGSSIHEVGGHSARHASECLFLTEVSFISLMWLARCNSFICHPRLAQLACLQAGFFRHPL